jgi:hypothetical protein
VATTAAPISANPFAGLLPRLAATVRQLREAPSNQDATHEERELGSLIEYALLHFGAPLLHANSADDLDDHLDALLETPDALLCTTLLARPLALAPAPESVSSDDFTSAVNEQFGNGAAKHLVEAKEILDAWLDAQRQLTAQMTGVPPTNLEEILSFSLADPTVPAELAEVVSHSLRASFCIMALAQALSTDEPIAETLALALVDRIVEGAKQHLRLLASLPGIVVDDQLVSRETRLDLQAIEIKHRRARATAERSLNAARIRLGS